LLLLQSAGLITLEDPKAIDATTISIVKNPKNLQFKEIESPQLPRALEDVDAAVINTNYALGANLNPSRDALFIEQKDSPYVNLLIANKNSAKNEDLKKVINELTSADVKKFIEKQYDGAVVPAF
jgi:D-methionine transport system substrate-binding protein